MLNLIQDGVKESAKEKKDMTESQVTDEDVREKVGVCVSEAKKREQLRENACDTWCEKQDVPASSSQL